MATRRVAVQDSTYGYVRDMDTGDVLDVVGNVAMNANKITGLADPTAAQDAATKAYVDSVAVGLLDFKNSVRLATAAALPANTASGTGVGKTLTADANGALSVDGVAVAVGNRILVKDEAAGANNGIYVVTDAGSAGTPYVLTRSTDADSDAETTAGQYMIVEAGTANADTAWVLSTNNPIVVDTTALTFTLFSTATSLTYDQGLVKSGASVAVELDASANGQGAGAGGGSSGLEFDANTASGKLRAAVHATGGIERTASGLAVKLNGDSLASAAGGLSVIHAERDQNSFTSGEAITSGDPVTFSPTANQVYRSRADNEARSFSFGIAMTTVGGSGSPVDVITHGPAAGVLSGATPGAPYYVAPTGGLTATFPSGGGNRRRAVGWAINATDLFVNIEDRGRAGA